VINRLVWEPGNDYGSLSISHSEAMNSDLAPFLAKLLLLPLSAYAQASAPDPLRLDPRIEPITQTLELQLDPAADSYIGVARIELQFHTSVKEFRFHAKDLALGRATLDGKELSLKPGEASLISATASDLVAAGKHTVEIAFSNEFNRDGTGLYKAVTGGKPYLFTQMEPVDARQAFPCWDEPSFKIPWRLTVTIPSDMEAVGNMPIAQTTLVGSNKVVEFGRTPPLPSYLVALAVGSFDFLPVPGQSVPGRIVTVQGQAALARLAAKEAPALLAELETYFGLPYPYAKLDHLAVPEFAFGAMENAGVITYKDSLLLLDPANVSYQQRRTLLEIIAHEMAHMWFGDLVTMQWWDDLWLNESFATWISFKIAGKVHPGLRFDLLSYQNIAAARAADTQPSVKQIRRLFRGGDNLVEAFDALSYSKGQAILRMVEGWVGEEKFRVALRRYFVRHSWGNARAEDLWSAFAEAGDESLREMLRQYIEQPGLPELAFARLPGDRCEVGQRRYRTLIGQSVAEQSWQVPIVLRYGGKTGVRTVRFLLTKEKDEFSAPGLDQADWIYPNAGESGYFTWSLPPELTTALTNRTTVPLSTTERLGVINAAILAVLSGSLPADRCLLLVLSFADDPEPEVKQAVVASLVPIQQTFLGASDRPAYARMLRGALRPMLDELGFAPKYGEPPQLGPLRAMLLGALGINGEDSEVVKFCRESAARQLSDPRSVDPGIADATLQVATWYGDAKWSERVRAAFQQATAPDVRGRFLGALVSFREPELARSGLDFVLSEAVKPTEFLRAIAVGQPELAPLAFEWLTEKYDAVKAKLPEDFLPFLPAVLSEADTGLLARGRAFFLDPARKTPLTELELTKATEAVELRTALRERNGSRVSKLVGELGANKAR